MEGNAFANLSQMDPRIFLAVALSGEREEPKLRACVWINATEGCAKFMPIANVQPRELRDGLDGMWDVDNFIFVNQDGPRVHVFKHLKAAAGSALELAMTPETSD